MITFEQEVLWSGNPEGWLLLSIFIKPLTPGWFLRKDRETNLGKKGMSRFNYFYFYTIGIKVHWEGSKI